MANNMVASIRRVENRRARRRLAKVRLADPKSLPHVTVGPHGGFSRGERQKILGAARALQSSGKPRKPHKPRPYNPLSPLSGKAFRNEINANAKLQYNPQIKQAKQDISDQDKHSALVSSAYDQYQAALQTALANTNKAYADAATDANTRLGTAYNQDVASASTPEGKQAAAAERALSNSALTTLKTSGASAAASGNTNVASSSLSKIEALNRENEARERLIGGLKQLKAQKGQFKVSERGKLRSDERTYALARKEFGLKSATLKETKRVDTANINSKKQANNAQVLVAKIYAAASRSKARATIRVARLQLKKGKIDQHQFNTIRNIYEGLPAKGTPGGVGKNGKPKAPKGSGPGGTFAPWERDDINRAMRGFNTNNYNEQQVDRAIQKAVAAGIPERLARAAWRRYRKQLRQSQHNNRTNQGRSSTGGRPDTAGNPNVSGTR